MTRKRRLVVTALLVVVVAIAGCQGGPETSVPEETPTADELSRQAASAMEDVETASFTMDMTVEAGGQTVDMEADGEMDQSAELMKMNMDMSVGSRDISATQYVDGSTAYINVNDRWQQMDMPGQSVWENSQIEQQRKLLEQSEVRLNGTEVVDNRHTYRVEVDANESVARSLIQQNSVATGGSMENIDIEGLSLTQYIDVESKHVRKVEMQMDMLVQGQDATADLTMTMSEFNEDVNIQIPDEAKSA